MYTNKSDDVQSKFNEFSNLFSIYHLGYKNQIKKWKHNPTEIIIYFLQNNFTKKHYIADLGCGEAIIAQTLKNWKIDSYDFIKYNSYITVCNITKLNKKDNTYDCIIISLSLMNTDWPKIIFESSRCLKIDGILIIAEVVSRIKKLRQFLQFFKNVGFKILKQVNLNEYFYLFFFRKYKKNTAIHLASENRIKVISKLLEPCIYKNR